MNRHIDRQMKKDKVNESSTPIPFGDVSKLTQDQYVSTSIEVSTKESTFGTILKIFYTKTQ